MSEVSKKVLERFRKLMALANNAGATEGEREAALHHANLLMRRYNLSLAELPADQNDEAREEQVFTVCGDRWLRDVCDSVAKLFFCKYLFSSAGTSGKWNNYFIGRQSNVVTAMHMSEYLIKSLKKEATKRYRSPTTPEGRSFCVGATRVLERRMYEMRIEAQTPTEAPAAAPSAMAEAMQGLEQDIKLSTSTAVALANLYKSEEDANAAWIDERFGKVKSEKFRAGGGVNSDAYHSGREHGKSVSLNQQVSGTSAPKRTLLK